jgi:hypothetical protein
MGDDVTKNFPSFNNDLLLKTEASVPKRQKRHLFSIKIFTETAKNASERRQYSFFGEK